MSSALDQPELDGAHRIDGGGNLLTQVIDDATDFERLAREWDELLKDSDQCVYFLRHRWNLLWWRHFAPTGSRLHVIICRSTSGQLIGFAPLYQRATRVLGIPVGRELVLLGMGVPTKTSEHVDLAARRGWESRVAAAVVASLRTTSWDRIWLSHVPSGSLILPHLARELGARVEICDRAPYVDTSKDWATFKGRFGRSMRRNVEYYPRRLFKTYPTAEFSLVESVDDVERAMDSLVELHRRRWRMVGEPGAFSRNFESFLREAVRDAVRSSRCLFSTIKIDGRIQAALVGFIDNGVVHYFQKGFNPEYARDEIGNVIVALSIRACTQDPRTNRFDFMGGGAPYKSLWAREATENVVAVFERPTFATTLINTRARLVESLRKLYRRVVPLWLRAARRDRLRRRRMQRLQLVVLGLCEPLMNLGIVLALV